MLIEAFAYLRLDVDQNAIRQNQKIGIGDDAALRIEKESVANLAGRKILHLIGRHGVQQASAIFTAGGNYSPRGKIQPGGAFTKSLITGSHTFSVLQLAYDPRDPASGDVAMQLLHPGRRSQPGSNCGRPGR